MRVQIFRIRATGTTGFAGWRIGGGDKPLMTQLRLTPGAMRNHLFGPSLRSTARAVLVGATLVMAAACTSQATAQSLPGSPSSPAQPAQTNSPASSGTAPAGPSTTPAGTSGDRDSLRSPRRHRAKSREAGSADGADRSPGSLGRDGAVEYLQVARHAHQRHPVRRRHL